jgi:putative ABC transport system permease protein
MIADLKYTLRSLAKRPGFTFVAILTLALGIGASTAIFSVVDAVLLRPAPYPNPDRLVEIRELDERGRGMAVCEPNFNDLAARNHSFAAIARYAVWTQPVASGRDALRANTGLASADFFRVLGVEPMMGRFFSNGKAEDVVVVSYGFWKRQLDSPASLDGVSIRSANRSYAVIGVMPAELEFPSGTDLWYPAETLPPNTSRSGHNWKVVARVKSDMTLEQARADSAAIGQQLKREYGREIDAVSFAALPLRERSVQDVRRILYVLCGAVAVLLLIAGSNVGNLLLVRATVRRKEIALRAALGASSRQLARQFITEALVLTLAGATLGAVLSVWGIDLVVGLYHGNLPQVGRIGINLKVLFFSLGTALVLGTALGLVPALHTSRKQLQNDLQDSGRSGTVSRANRRVRNALIVAQVALTLMLLVGAGLLGRSFQQLLSVNPGFIQQSAVAMTISMPDAEDPKAQRTLAQFCQQLLVRLEGIPGIIAVGATNALPMSGNGANGRFLIEEGGVTVGSMEEFGKKMTALLGTDRLGDAQHRVVSGSYFETMHIPLRRGRTFQDGDGPDNPHVAVISESLARRYFPNADPLGKQLQFGNMDGDLHLLNVVGVVGDIRDQTLDANPEPTVYVNYFQRGSLSDFSYVVRSQSDVASLIAALRREAQRTNPEMPVKFETLEQLVSSSLDDRRFGMIMVGEFAVAALLLAMVGLYGVMAYITAERTQEFGIRMALGAQRADMLRMIFRQSFALVLSGVGIGIVISIGLTRLIASMLYDVRTTDVVTYGGVIGLLVAAAALASYLPARRAMKVDPMVALRYE